MQHKQVAKIGILCLCIILILTGCNGYKEINRLSFIIGMGVDKIGKTSPIYRVTFQIVNPRQVSSSSGSSGSSQGVGIINYVGYGKTLSEAARNTSKKIMKESYYSHISLLIVGEDVAKDDIRKVIDVFERDAKIRVRTPILISRHTTAESILNALTPANVIPSVALNQKIKNTEGLLGENTLTSINEVIQNITSPGEDIAISGIKLPANAKNIEKMSHLDKTKPAEPIVDGMALFRGGKLVHWVSGKKTRTLSMAVNKLKGTNITVPCGKNQYVSVAINEARMKKSVKMRNATPDVTIHVTAKGNIDEVMCDQDFKSVTTIKKIEKKVENTLQKEIQEMFSVSKHYKSDVFAIGRTLHKSNPKQWKQYKQNWGSVLSKAHARVHINVSIKQTGTSSNSILYRKK
ncbi:Ger(x)C family spore germination protein [Bacillus rhizoplanae]|uniref:Ger(x)C family spore germination protein n=1 Tax=Bacillus rhizoplanae TaxID=2880966 RepID=UPI003D22190C